MRRIINIKFFTITTLLTLVVLSPNTLLAQGCDNPRDLQTAISCEENEEANQGAGQNVDGSLLLDENTRTLDTGDTIDETNEIYVELVRIINFLSVGVGIVIAISVAIAGLQYTTSRGEPGKTAAAVNRLSQAGLAAFLFIFGWLIINWLIPGGVLN